MLETKNIQNTYKTSFFLVCLAFALFICGYIPFYTTGPTHVVAWVMGFAQSFAQQSLLSIYAYNFGYPNPAAIAFGLAGAWPASLFLRLGALPPDAYTLMMDFWLIIAFTAAYRLGRFFGVNYYVSVLMALYWLSMPMVWNHNNYAMLSLGIALLPFYFLSVFKLLSVEKGKGFFYTIALYLLSAIIAVFMDGYTFMMFAAGASLLYVVQWVSFPQKRQHFYMVVFPTHFLSFSIAYGLYALFIGHLNFPAHSIDVFRAFGVDLSFLVIPTKGTLFLADMLNWGMVRNTSRYFADYSTWVTTFCLPLLLLGVYSWYKIRKKQTLVASLFLVGLLGFYLALGPSLKINTVRPAKTPIIVILPEQTAEKLLPTGNAWISKHLPGFKTMRAAYRWLALAMVAFWMLFLLLLTDKNLQRHKSIYILLLGLITLNLPHLEKLWQEKKQCRQTMIYINNFVVKDLKKFIHPNELIAFVPYGDDFFAGYLALKLGIFTYNIGGDKNVEMAQQNWPSSMLALHAPLNPGMNKNIVLLLSHREADAVIIPYVNLMFMNKKDLMLKKQKKLAMPLLQKLSKNPLLTIKTSEFFAIIRINKEGNILEKKHS